MVVLRHQIMMCQVGMVDLTIDLDDVLELDDGSLEVLLGLGAGDRYRV